MPKRVAIIGGGIAGLTAAYLLHKNNEIRLFEKSSRVGGNAYTYATHDGQYLDIAVAAFGKSGYPNFYSLLKELGVGTKLCASSFVSLYDLEKKKGLYLAPPSRSSGGKISLGVLNPTVLKVGAELLLGLKKAQTQLAAGKLKDKTFGQCMDEIFVLRGNTRRTLVSILCLMSSMSAEEVLESPAEFFLKKLKVHDDVISPKAMFSVRCADGGTKSYVNAMASKFRDKIVLNSQIQSVDRTDDHVTIKMKNGEAQQFDSVVMACNADQALALLSSPSDQEKECLGAWRYKDGRVVVHKDHSSFPKRESIQAYTFLYTDRGGKFSTSVNGALWHEPNVPDSSDYISSQHPNFPIREDLIEYDTTLRTPIFDRRSLSAIGSLPKLNGCQNTYYCGSHFGFGLHEDAVSSAMEVAKLLGSDFETRTGPRVISSLQTLFGP